MPDATPTATTSNQDDDWIVDDPQPLLRRLLYAIQRYDGRSIYYLCKVNSRLVQESFKPWLRHAEDLRSDAAQYHSYLNGLYVIAKTMSDSVGEGRLFGTLVHARESNAFARWERKLEQGQKLMGELSLDEAASLLSDHLIDVRHLPGYGYRHMMATTHWYISQAHFNARRRDDAVAHCERSLAITEEIKDHPRYRLRYLDYLMEIHRYFGEGNQAATLAERVADFYQEFKDEPQIRWHRSLAEVMRQGEPLTRVIIEVDTGQYELNDLPNVSGDFSLHIIRNRRELGPTLILSKRARDFANKEKYVEALGLLKQAAEADPFDPSPAEEAGDLRLATGELAEAAEAYEKAEQLAPGLSNCRTKHWLITQVMGGRYGEELIPTIWKLWVEELKPDERLEAVKLALRQHPTFALLHRQHGEALRAMGRTQEAAAAFARGLGCECDNQVRTQLLLGAAQLAEKDSPERRQLVEQAAELNGDLIAGAMAKLIVRLGFPALNIENS